MTLKENGQFLCDAQCVSTKICSHTVAATEHSGHLSDFLQLYITTNQCTNMTTAGMMPRPGCHADSASPWTDRGSMYPHNTVQCFAER